MCGSCYEKSLKIVLITMLMVIFVSCSNSGGESSGTTVSDVVAPKTGHGVPLKSSVSLEIPTGYSQPLADFNVTNALGSVQLNNDNTFTVTYLDGSTQLTFAVNHQGEPMLMGWVNAKHNVINTHTTAAVLLYYSLGMSLAALNTSEAILDELLSLDETTKVAQFIETALAKSPKSTKELIGMIEDDVSNVITQLRNKENNATTTVFRSLINPSQGKSGIAINELDSDTFQITNNYRRRAIAWVDRISYKTEDNRIVPFEAQIHTIDIDTTSGFSGTIATFYDVTQSNVKTWLPTQTAPFDLPLLPEDAIKTNYKISVLGLGNQDGEYPTFSDERKKERYRLYALSFIDYTLPFLTNIVMPAFGKDYENDIEMSEIVQFVGKSEALIKSILGLSGFITAVDNKDYSSAFKEVVASDVVQDTLIDLLGKYLTKEVAEGIYQYDKYNLKGAAKTARKYLFISDAFFTSIDYLVINDNLANAKMGETWDVNVTRPKITLTPKKGSINPRNSSLKLKVKVLEALQSGDSFFYIWSMKHSVGGTINGSTKTYRTTHAEVNYSADADKLGNATEVVHVEAFKVDATHPEGKSIGEEQATIEIRAAAPELWDRLNSIEPNGSEARVDVKMRPSWQGNTLVYKWRVTESVGALLNGFKPIDYGTASYIVYKANDEGREGKDTVSVEAYAIENGAYRYIGSDTAEIRVEFEPTILDGERDVTFYTYSAAGTTVGATRTYLIFDKVEYAQSYRVTGMCKDPDPEVCVYGQECNSICNWGAKVEVTFSSGTTNENNLDITKDYRWRAEMGTPPDGKVWLIFAAAGGPGDDGSKIPDRHRLWTSGYRWKAEVIRGTK